MIRPVLRVQHKDASKAPDPRVRILLNYRQIKNWLRETRPTATLTHKFHEIQITPDLKSYILQADIKRGTASLNIYLTDYKICTEPGVHLNHPIADEFQLPVPIHANAFVAPFWHPSTGQAIQALITDKLGPADNPPNPCTGGTSGNPHAHALLSVLEEADPTLDLDATLEDLPGGTTRLDVYFEGDHLCTWYVAGTTIATCRAIKEKRIDHLYETAEEGQFVHEEAVQQAQEFLEDPDPAFVQGLPDGFCIRLDDPRAIGRFAAQVPTMTVLHQRKKRANAR